MRLKDLMRYLKKWQSLGFIKEEQIEKIAEHMKVEAHIQFKKLIRVLYFIGALWLIVGLIATIRKINIEIWEAFVRFLEKLITPFVALAKLISPEHYTQLLAGVSCLLCWGLFHWLGIRFRKRSKLSTTELGFLQDRELQWGTSFFLFGYISASFAWQFLNYVVYPSNCHASCMGVEVVFPIFSLIGMIFFMVIAYLMRDQIALLFGIGFLAHTVGFPLVYWCACYVWGVPMLVTQLIVGILLVYVGLWHIEKVSGKEGEFQFSFGRTYEWTGLLIGFFSLWIMSIIGITYREHWTHPPDVELWIANLSFIAASLLALFYGAIKEDRMFFNFGLTFLIIVTYNLFFTLIWGTVGTAVGSLLLGIMLIATGYILRRLWLKGRIFKKLS